MVKRQHEASPLLHSLPSVFKTVDNLQNKTGLFDAGIVITVGLRGMIGVQKHQQLENLL